jgi:hypothetical protein
VLREVPEHAESLVRQADRILAAPQPLVGHVEPKGFKDKDFSVSHGPLPAGS